MQYSEAVKRQPENLGRYPIVYNSIVYAHTQLGNIFICSLEDYDLVVGHKITERKDEGYVEFYIDHKSVKLNKLIAERIAPTGKIIDHIDGIRLNYVRNNLRPATIQDNNRNRRSKIGKSGFIGVTVRQYRGGESYSAGIVVNNRNIHIGTYDTAEQAALTRDFVALFFFGKFARLNNDF